MRNSTDDISPYAPVGPQNERSQFCSRPACPVQALKTGSGNLYQGCPSNDLKLDISPARVFTQFLRFYPRLRQAFCLINTSAPAPKNAGGAIDGHPFCLIQVIETSENQRRFKTDQRNTFRLLSRDTNVWQQVFLASNSAASVCTPCTAALFATLFPVPSSGTEVIDDAARWNITGHLTSICGSSFVESVTARSLPKDVQNRSNGAAALGHDYFQVGPDDLGTLDRITGADTDQTQQQSSNANGASTNDASKNQTDDHILTSDSSSGTQDMNATGNAGAAVGGSGSGPQGFPFPYNHNLSTSSAVKVAPKHTTSVPNWSPWSEIELAFYLNLMIGVVVFVMAAPLLIL